MSPLVPTYSMTCSLGKSGEMNVGENNSYVAMLATLLGLLARVLVWVLLLGLLVVASLVWVWLASFRAGSRFGSWVYSFWEATPEGQNQLTLALLYSSILTVLAPLVVFGDWSQQVIGKAFPNLFSPKKDLKQMLESHLGIELPKDFPCLPKAD